MRHPMVLALAAALLLGGCSSEQEAEEVAFTLPDGAEVLGEDVTVTGASITLAAVRANPEAYFEKTLLVEATAQNICQQAGCWMTITIWRI